MTDEELDSMLDPYYPPEHIRRLLCAQCRRAALLGVLDRPEHAHDQRICSCGAEFLECAFIEKDGRGLICPSCAHEHELARFQGQHDPAECRFCIPLAPASAA